jgi:hypothetical protein
MDLINSIFKNQKDWNSWEKHKEYAFRTTEISDLMKKDLLDALEFIKSEFGSDFLTRTEHTHPVRQKITDKSYWRFEDLIRFTTTLDKLKESSINYKKLLVKLLGTDSSQNEGIPFFETSASFYAIGSVIEFLEEIPNQKTSDLKITLPITNDVIYIEISVVNDSDLTKKMNENYRVITSFLFLKCPQVPHSGMQLQLIPNDKMNSVIAGIFKTMERALNHPGSLISYRDDYIDFRAENSPDFKHLEKWYLTNNLRKGFQAPVNYNETTRIENNKIRQKAKQIPTHATGIIYFPASTFYFMQLDIAEAITVFNNRMKYYPNLLGVVLSSEAIDPQEPKEIKVGNHFYGVKMMNQVIARKLLFVHNESYAGDLSNNSLNSVYKSFL